MIYNTRFQISSRNTKARGPLLKNLEGVELDIIVINISAYSTAQSSIMASDELPSNTKKTLILCGDNSNRVVDESPKKMTLGIGRAASAYWVGVADADYKEMGYWYVLLSKLHIFAIIIIVTSKIPYQILSF